MKVSYIVKYCFLMIFGIGVFGLTQAQDILYFHSGKSLPIILVEITEEILSYKPYENPNQAPFMIDKDQVRGIVYQSSSNQKRWGEINHPKPRKIHEWKIINYKIQKELPYRFALKTNLFALPLNHADLGLEWRLGEKKGMEIHLGYIGLGMPGITWSRDTYSQGNYNYTTNTYERESRQYRRQETGFFVKFGGKYTFIQQNSFSGWYVKPELVFTRYRSEGNIMRRDENYSHLDYDYAWTYQGTQAGLLANLGYQIAFTQRLLLDLHGSIGMVFPFHDLKMEGDKLPDPTYYAYSGQMEYPGIPTKYYRNYPTEIHYSHFGSKSLSYNLSVGLGVLLGKTTVETDDN